MKLSNRLAAPVFSFFIFTGFVWLSGCVPVDTVQRPSLNEVRSGAVRGPSAEDRRLEPGEVSAEIDQIDPARREIRVITDNGRRDVLRYDFTRVTYHGWDYAVADLEAGDRIAFRTAPRDKGYLESIRLQEPIQARAAPSGDRAEARRSRNDVVEGTVDRIDYDRGIFDVLPASRGRTVTVSLPYNARRADVDSFRALRRGDRVRVEGEFVNPDNLQLLAFLSSP